MISDALRVRPDFILADESSRFSRNREVAIRVKRQLREAGIRILFVNEPEVDPHSIAGLWLEGIQELKNEATSREIAFSTIRGMRANVAARDPETGWCYHNGGRPPFGYRRRVLDKGNDTKGKPVRKTILELDPDHAPVVRLIIVELYTRQRMSYEHIRDHLNARAIACPTGTAWGTCVVRRRRSEALARERTRPGGRAAVGRIEWRRHGRIHRGECGRTWYYWQRQGSGRVDKRVEGDPQV